MGHNSEGLNCNFSCDFLVPSIQAWGGPRVYTGCTFYCKIVYILQMQVLEPARGAITAQPASSILNPLHLAQEALQGRKGLHKQAPIQYIYTMQIQANVIRLHQQPDWTADAIPAHLKFPHGNGTRMQRRPWGSMAI